MGNTCTGNSSCTARSSVKRISGSNERIANGPAACLLSGSFELRQLALERASSPLEAGERQRACRDDIGWRFLRPDDEIRTLSDFDPVVAQTHELRRAPGDHVEADGEVLRTVALDHVRVKVRDARERAIP